MANKKTTKRALLFSLLSMLLSVTMLMGTTFAWFTDSVTSANNIIKSGNLDIELYYQNDETTDWTKVDASTNIFKENTLWEPGHTEVVKLKVVNAGTLALKYQLGVNVASETGSVNVYDKAFKLSDYIKYGVTTDTVKDRADAIAKVDATATGLSLAYTTNGDLQAGAATEMTMVVYMPTSVDNNANYKKGAAVPTINLGLNLFATQYTYEEDSFGNDYDENAAFSVWNGVVPTEMPETLVVDGATQTVYVKDAAAFAYLSTLSAKWADLYTDGKGTTYTNYANGAGANYYYSGKWTVSLEADIDLANHALDPVVIMFGQATGASAFDGNGHTIRNINADTGLFANSTRASFSNLILENVKATNGALAGTADHNISNITVKNANISGTDYVGGLVGYTYGAVNGCKVMDSFVVATGKEAGGLAGYVVTSRAEATLANNMVQNVSVYANNRAAGLVAQLNVNIKAYNNIIDTVTVGAEDLSKYACGAVVSNALAPENVYDNTVKNATVEAAEIAIVGDTTELTDALATGSDDTVVLNKGNYTFPGTKLEKGDKVVCAEGAVFEKGAGLNANGATVIGATFSNPTGTAGTSTVNGTYKDCTFDGSNGLRWCYAGETVVFENCTFTGDVYGVHFDGGANEAIFRNCTFSGFNAMGGAITKLTMEGCTFKANGRSGYNGINLWGNTEMKNCTFVFDGTTTEWIDACSDNKTLTFTDCKISDGTTERALAVSDVGDYGTGNTITVN